MKVLFQLLCQLESCCVPAVLHGSVKEMETHGRRDVTIFKLIQLYLAQSPVPSPRWVMLVHHSLLRTRMNPGMIVRRSASRDSVATSEMSHNPRPGILLEVISQKIAHQSIVSPAWPLHTIHHNKMSPVLGDQDNLHGCL